MRILIVGTTYYPAFNGQAVFTTHLAEGLAGRGHEVVVVLPSDQGHPYRWERNGVCIQRINSIELGPWHKEAYYSVFPGREVERILHEFRPEIVHLNDHYTISEVTLKLARRQGCIAVGTNHFMPENLAPYIPLAGALKPAVNKILWQWLLGVYNRLDVVTAPSRTAANILRKQGLRVPVYPISCGIDLGQFHPDGGVERASWLERYQLDPQRRIFLFVGRVDAEKRLDVLLDALRQVDRDDIQLAVAGKGAHLAALKAMAEGYHLGDRVRFLGFVPDTDLPALLNSADIFAMPSEAELLSIASLEAMASGRPMLAAESQALPELVHQGVNGLLFRPGDAADAARAMAWLADHPEQWTAMGAASLEKARQHSLENSVRSYEQIYEMALAGNRQALSAGMHRVERQPETASRKPVPVPEKLNK